jgi:hypothetical protein
MDRNRTELDYLRMAFWALAADTNESIPDDVLLRISNELNALAEDAISYWLNNGKAPYLTNEEVP